LIPTLGDGVGVTFGARGQRSVDAWELLWLRWLFAMRVRSGVGLGWVGLPAALYLLAPVLLPVFSALYFSYSQPTARRRQAAPVPSSVEGEEVKLRIAQVLLAGLSPRELVETVAPGLGVVYLDPAAEVKHSNDPLPSLQKPWRVTGILYGEHRRLMCNMVVTRGTRARTFSWRIPARRIPT
jgi:hypothetical protein